MRCKEIKSKNMTREEGGCESKKYRHIKLIKIEVERRISIEMRQRDTQRNNGKQDEENRMNGNRRKSGSDAKRLARYKG